MRHALVIFGLVLSMPLSVHATVGITEIAWMGTDEHHSNEWIELYNESGGAVDLEGWTIESADGKPAIALSGAIGAGEFYILERTDDSTLPGITADQFYTGALSNGGEALSLKQNGKAVLMIDVSGGWPAGDNDTKETMQWNGSTWITAPATPRALYANNSSITSSASPLEPDEQKKENDPTPYQISVERSPAEPSEPQEAEKEMEYESLQETKPPEAAEGEKKEEDTQKHILTSAETLVAPRGSVSTHTEEEIETLRSQLTAAHARIDELERRLAREKNTKPAAPATALNKESGNTGEPPAPERHVIEVKREESIFKKIFLFPVRALSFLKNLVF